MLIQKSTKNLFIYVTENQKDREKRSCVAKKKKEAKFWATPKRYQRIEVCRRRQCSRYITAIIQC